MVERIVKSALAIGLSLSLAAGPVAAGPMPSNLSDIVYHRYVSLDDLVGAKGSSADSELRAGGFQDKGGYKQGDKSFATWWSRDTRQCVQVTTRDGRIRKVESIYEGNCL